MNFRGEINSRCSLVEEQYIIAHCVGGDSIGNGTRTRPSPSHPSLKLLIHLWCTWKLKVKESKRIRCKVVSQLLSNSKLDDGKWNIYYTQINFRTLTLFYVLADCKGCVAVAFCLSSSLLSSMKLCCLYIAILHTPSHLNITNVCKWGNGWLGVAETAAGWSTEKEMRGNIIKIHDV